MQNNSQDFEEKPSSNKDMWLFLIVLDVIFLCVFGFFLYKQFSGKLFNPAPVGAAASTQVHDEDSLPVITEEEEVVAIAEGPLQQVSVPEEIGADEPIKEPVKEPAKEPAKQEAPTVEEKAPAAQVPAQKEVKESIVITPTTGKYRKVTFRWFGEGNKVSVVSGFTMSKPQALKKVGDHWETTLSIAPGTYKFLYIVDGKNTLDPYADEKDGRSVLEVK